MMWPGLGHACLWAQILDMIVTAASSPGGSQASAGESFSPCNNGIGYSDEQPRLADIDLSYSLLHKPPCACWPNTVERVHMGC